MILNVKVYKFLREADQLIDWINEQITVAASEDYGRDVEHVEILIQKFESFLSTLNARLVFHSIYLFSYFFFHSYTVYFAHFFWLSMFLNITDKLISIQIHIYY